RELVKVVLVRRITPTYVQIQGRRRVDGRERGREVGRINRNVGEEIGETVGAYGAADVIVAGTAFEVDVDAIDASGVGRRVVHHCKLPGGGPAALADEIVQTAGAIGVLRAAEFCVHQV